MSKYSAVKILKGSASIDRMRSEINSIYRMFGGLLNTTELANWNKDNEVFHLKSSREGYYWSMRSTRGPGMNPRGKLKVEILFHKRTDRNAPDELLVCDSWISYANVSWIHSELDEFIRLCIEAFPEIKERLDPFVAAA